MCKILFLFPYMDQIYVLHEKYIRSFSLFIKNENCGDIMFCFISVN